MRGLILKSLLEKKDFDTEVDSESLCEPHWLTWKQLFGNKLVHSDTWHCGIFVQSVPLLKY